MNELIEEATQLEKLVADHSFRFSATEAYFKLTESRLDMLREKKIPTVRTLKQFHVRRFIPALIPVCRWLNAKTIYLSVSVAPVSCCILDSNSR